MRVPALIAALLLSLPALADEPKPWPQKKDTVFVPGELTGQFLAETSLTGDAQSITVPACTPLQVSFAPKPEKLTVVDIARAAYFPLCGDWRPWIVQTLDACKAAQPLTFQKKGKCYAPLPPG